MQYLPWYKLSLLLWTYIFWRQNFVCTQFLGARAPLEIARFIDSFIDWFTKKFQNSKISLFPVSPVSYPSLPVCYLQPNSCSLIPVAWYLLPNNCYLTLVTSVLLPDNYYCLLWLFDYLIWFLLSDTCFIIVVSRY